MAEQQPHRFDWLRLFLLAMWATASFGVSWFARDLQQVVAGWPVNFWFVAQGAVLAFLAVVVIYATVRNRQDRAREEASSDGD